MLEKGPKKSLWGNSEKITATKPFDVFMVFIVISLSRYYILISNLNTPFKSSYKDEPFGTKIIAI